MQYNLFCQRTPKNRSACKGVTAHLCWRVRPCSTTAETPHSGARGSQVCTTSAPSWKPLRTLRVRSHDSTLDMPREMASTRAGRVRHADPAFLHTMSPGCHLHALHKKITLKTFSTRIFLKRKKIKRPPPSQIRGINKQKALTVSGLVVSQRTEGLGKDEGRKHIRSGVPRDPPFWVPRDPPSWWWKEEGEARISTATHVSTIPAGFTIPPGDILKRV